MNTPKGPETGTGVESASDRTDDSVDVTAKRRPYRKPELHDLGSVGEITRGSAGMFPDGVGMFQMGKKMM